MKIFIVEENGNNLKNKVFTVVIRLSVSEVVKFQD